MQVLVPESGGRLVIGSDGVWDAFDTNARVCKLMRSAAPKVSAPTAAFVLCARQGSSYSQSGTVLRASDVHP